jgi:hypothetical protein
VLIENKETKKNFHDLNSLGFKRTDKEAWLKLKKLIEKIQNENMDIKRKDSIYQDIKWVWTVEIIDFWHMNDFFDKTHYFKSLLVKSQDEYFQETNLKEAQEWPLFNHKPVFLDFSIKLLNLLFGQFKYKERAYFWKNPLISCEQITNLIKLQQYDFQMSLHLYIFEVFWNFIDLVSSVHSAEQITEPKFFTHFDFKTVNCKSFLIKISKVD